MTTNTFDQKEFFDRWKKEVVAFCRVFLGEVAAAEEAACQALVSFCRENSSLLEPRAIQSRLLRFAILAAQKNETGHSEAHGNGSRLEAAIRQLPQLERAVVIMRNLLRMDWESVAGAAALSTIQTQKVWRLGISQLTELLRNGG